MALARRQPVAARELLGKAFAIFNRLPPFLAPADRTEYESLAQAAGVKSGQ